MWRGFVSAYRKCRIKTDEVRRAAIIDQQRQAEKEWDEHQQQTRHQEIIAALQGIVRQQQAYANERKADDNRRRTAECRRFWLDVTGVIIAAAAATFLLWQQSTMQEQVDEMRAEQRPWLIISDISVSQIKKVSDRSLDITFTYTLKNVGKLPATMVRPRYDTIDTVEFTPISEKSISLEGGLRGDKEYRHGLIVSPGQQRSFEKVHVSMPIASSDAKEGRCFPVLLIGILYNAAGYEQPRVASNVFRLHSGEPGNTGLTTEFFSPGVWFKDLATPLMFIRVTEIGELGKVS